MAGTTSTRETAPSTGMAHPGPGPAVERERLVPRRIWQLQQELVLNRGKTQTTPSGSGPAAGRWPPSTLEFHDRQQAAIDAWANTADDPATAETITTELAAQLDGANYTLITMAELRRPLNEESLIPLRLEVDLDESTRY